MYFTAIQIEIEHAHPWIKILTCRGKGHIWKFSILEPFLKPWFLCVCSRSLLKTLWEKEKLLVTSNFSFSYSVFLTVWRTFCHFHEIQNCRLQILSIWNSLKFVVWERNNPLPNTDWFLTLPENIILDIQIESICRRHKRSSKCEICFQMGRKQCGKRRKCWLPAFSPFPKMFSKFKKRKKLCFCVVEVHDFWAKS